MKRLFLTVLLAISMPALAEDTTSSLAIGGDVYKAGRTIIIDQPGTNDVFAAGEILTLDTPITGSAHLSGRRVTVNAPIDRNLYAAGADVTVAAGLGGNATMMGYDLNVTGAIAGNLRAAGRHIRIDAPVTGVALLAGQTVTLNSTINGNAMIAADELEFGPDAKIDGDITLFSDNKTFATIPESVAPASRITRRDVSENMRHGSREKGPEDWAKAGGGILGTFILIALLATIVASLAPHKLEHLGDLAFSRPFRSLFAGFVTQSCLLGATILLILSFFGILLAPVLLMMTAIFGILGYLIAVYLIGRLVWNLIGQLPPDTFLERLVVSLVGAVVVTIIAIVPILGWIAVPVLSLIGLGALTLIVLRPEFRAD